MIKKRQVFICESHRARVHGGGCCSDKGAGTLAQTLEKLIEAENLQDHISVKRSDCLRNCRQGISVRVMPDNVLYSRVKPEDLPRLIEQHFKQNLPLRELQLGEIPKFFSF